MPGSRPVLALVQSRFSEHVLEPEPWEGPEPTQNANRHWRLNNLQNPVLHTSVLADSACPHIISHLGVSRLAVNYEREGSNMLDALSSHHHHHHYHSSHAPAPPPRALFLPLPSLRDVGLYRWKHLDTRTGKRNRRQEPRDRR